MRLGHVLLFSSLLMASGCASTASDEDEKPKGLAAYADDARLGEQVKKICFTSSIDNFRSPERETVIVERGVRDEYILEVTGSCPNLRYAQRLALDTSLSCLTKFDNLYVYDSAFGTISTPGSVDRCPIKSIHKWNEDALKDTEAETEEKDETDPAFTRPIK